LYMKLVIYEKIMQNSRECLSLIGYMLIKDCEIKYENVDLRIFYCDNSEIL